VLTHTPQRLCPFRPLQSASRLRRGDGGPLSRAHRSPAVIVRSRASSHRGGVHLVKAVGTQSKPSDPARSLNASGLGLSLRDSLHASRTKVLARASARSSQARARPEWRLEMPRLFRLSTEHMLVAMRDVSILETANVPPETPHRSVVQKIVRWRPTGRREITSVSRGGGGASPATSPPRAYDRLAPARARLWTLASRGP